VIAARGIRSITDRCCGGVEQYIIVWQRRSEINWTRQLIGSVWTKGARCCIEIFPRAAVDERCYYFLIFFQLEIILSEPDYSQSCRVPISSNVTDRTDRRYVHVNPGEFFCTGIALGWKTAVIRSNFTSPRTQSIQSVFDSRLGHSNRKSTPVRRGTSHPSTWHSYVIVF